jgi:precorrin-2 dehydrogenase/sirohydrochlorin ferrochelatase
MERRIPWGLWIGSMGLFGMFIELADRECLVVGGGSVGTRKVESLLEAGARVTVVSREVTPELKRLIDGGMVAYRGESFAPAHLAGMLLCVSALDDRAGNEAVAGSCRKRGVLVNVVDDPALSDFFFPSLVRRGDLVVAVSSGGVAPSLVKRIRRDLEKAYGPEYAQVLQILGRLREKLRGAGISGDGLSAVMERAAALPLAGMISGGRTDRVVDAVRAAVAEGGVALTIDAADLMDPEGRQR